MPQRVARDLMQFSFDLGKANRPQDWTTMAYVRYHLAQLGLGEEVAYVQWSPSRRMILPPLAEVPEAS